jgi:hypothetical protein
MALQKKMNQEEFQDFVIARLANMDTLFHSMLELQIQVMKKLGTDEVEIKRIVNKIISDSARFVDFYDFTED